MARARANTDSAISAAFDAPRILQPAFRGLV